MAAALEKLPPITDERVLVGLNTADDAGVIRLSDELALVVTVDIFTPIVDDPYMYGQISAANSLSDVYAMGGTPYCALNIVGFPKDIFPIEVLAEILRGGADKAREANTVILGGHTISDDELKYGLAVTGLIHPDKIITNANARPGDVLILTKPIGTGTITTALKAGKGTEPMIKYVTQLMVRLNKTAAEVCLRVGINACTDITGFGLLGHALEVAHGSGVGLVFKFDDVPFIPDAVETTKKGFVPGGTKANHLYAAPDVEYADRLGMNEQYLLCDPQTSGGLLISVPEDRAERLRKELTDAGDTACIIGYVTKENKGKIKVV